MDKIVGPGNRWVAEAKRQVVGQVGIDMIAGPTEVLIIADATARPERVAADLIAQAEHDEDATSWCVTTDPDLADALPAALERALATAPRAAIARAALERNGLIVLAGIDARRDRGGQPPGPGASADRRRGSRADRQRRFGTPAPSSWATIRRSRSGTISPGPAMCFRPAGTARYASPLGVYDFVKRTSVIRYTPARLGRDAAAIIALAEAEGLYGHAEAVRMRGSGAAGQRGR